MPMFHYRAARTDGTVTEASMEASNEASLRLLLERQGLVPLSFGGERSGVSLRRPSLSFLRRRRLSLREGARAAGPGAGGGERLAVVERGRDDLRGQPGPVRAGGSRQVLPQGDDRKEADEADDDDGRFKDTRRDIAKGDGFALPLDDGEQHDRGGDARDGGDDLQERAELHARVGAGTEM